ncbi:Glycoside hydrolase family 76 protein [Mycena venus]|uniref:Glycoside hydrolase family 76 protein n=1 Tax=Mycena venus TaxID=2733690 RepID=A0A8H6XX73_9AGAR|nr:Glycoside hydrolase family 76 protein [Mycena venus]
MSPNIAQELGMKFEQRPNITISLEDRLNIADAAIETAINKLGPDAQFDGKDSGYTGHLYSQMAAFDTASNQTKYKDTLKEYFLRTPNRSSNFSNTLFHVQFPLSTSHSAYGHAGAIAYAAYKDQVFLDYAIQSWWFGQTYTLTSQQVAAGRTDIKNFTIQSQCQELTMSTDLDSAELNTLSTGNFLVLSALLAEATSNPMYLQAAIDSANFVADHLLNGVHQIQDSVSADVCRNDSFQASYNAGLVIEGLSILHQVTGDAAMLTMLNDIVNATIPNPAWQQSNGVLKSGDLYLPRGLTTLYARKVTPDFQDDIGHYIAVQFNAATDLAMANGTNIYGKSWAGPPNSAFDPHSQVNALEALISAISLPNDPGSESPALPTPFSAPTESGSAPSLPQHSSNKSVIIGIVLGAVALMGVAMGVWAIGRPGRRSKSTSIGVSRVSPFGIWYNSRRRGKLSKDALDEAPAPVAVPRAAKKATVPRRVPPVAPAQNSTPFQPHVNLPTEELVRILNERLQERDWDEGEALPEYPV